MQKKITKGNATPLHPCDISVCIRYLSSQIENPDKAWEALPLQLQLREAAPVLYASPLPPAIYNQQSDSTL